MAENNGFMIKELLYTAEGGFVTEVELPPFLTKPEVLIWGARVFIHVDSFNPVDFYDLADKTELTDQEAKECYVEAFAYYVPPRIEDLPKRDLLEMIGSTAADMSGVKTALGDAIPMPTDVAPDHYMRRVAPNHLQERGKEIAERLFERIKSDPRPDQTAAGYCSQCGVKMPDHTPECPIFKAAAAIGQAVIDETVLNGEPGQFKGYCVLCGTPGGEHRLSCPHKIKESPEPLNPEMFPGEDYPSK